MTPAPPSRVTVTAVLACHNRRARTVEALAALLRQDAAVDLDIVVFDDGSTDGTAAAVRALCPKATILQGDGRAFWSGGMGRAFAAAFDRQGDFCLWLNDDAQLAADALGRLLATDAELAAAGHALRLVGGALADPVSGRSTYAGVLRRRRPLAFTHAGPHPTTPRRCDTLLGNVVLVPRAVATRFGTIDPAFRQTLGDLDYGLRVAAAGGWVGLAPGFAGTCAREPAGRWIDPSLPLRRRWRLVGHPHGFPLRPWLHFARRHGGPAWWLFAPLPYWRLFVPSRLAERLDALRLHWSGAPRHA